MVMPERRVTVTLPSYGEVMEEVKLEVLRVVGQKVIEFQEMWFSQWFGEPWERGRDGKGIILCFRCGESPGFERRGKRQRSFYTRYGKVGSALLQVTCKGCGCTFSPFVGFFSEKGKRYCRDLVQSLVVSALTVSYHETSRRAGREAGINAAAITVWRKLREAYQKYQRRGKKTSLSGGVLVADSTGVQTGKSKRGSSLNLAVKVTGRKLNGKRAKLDKELVTLGVGKWHEDELKETMADLVITEATPSLKALSVELNRILASSTVCSMLREVFTKLSIRMELTGNADTGKRGSGGSFRDHRLRE